MKLKLSRNKILLIMARKQLCIADVAEHCGVSRARAGAMLRQSEIAPAGAGRLASALGVDAAEIVDSE